MARKKFYVEKAPVQPKNNKWFVALYIRLSREDGDKAESDSVVNQRKLLKYFVEDHDEFLNSECFIDENVTGTNFERPAFQRMLRKIKDGKINCVIVKDLSRFGRDYIGAGYYLEHVFDEYGCRFISVIDELDSEKQNLTELTIRIKNLCHDKNSQDISQNVRYIKDLLRSEGKYISPAPYGYAKDPNNKYHLVIDDEVVPVIKNIFDWYIQGMGTIRIAQRLNELGVTPRKQYRETKRPYVRGDEIAANNSWKPEAIREMLTNKVYIGAVDQKRATTRNYKDRKEIILPEEEHIIVYDMHEPIISREKYDEVQDILNKRCIKTANYRDAVYLLSGFMRCQDCHSSMIRNSTFQKGRRYTYYKCRGYNQKGNKICSHPHSIREEDIYPAVIATLNAHIKTLLDIKRILKEINASRKIANLSLDYDKLLLEKEKKIDYLRTLKMNSYSDWKMNTLSKQDYLFMADRFETMLIQAEREKIQLEKEKLAEQDIRNNEFLWLEEIIKHGYIKELTRELLVATVDKIYVSRDLKISIVFQYEDEFRRLADYTAEHIDGLCNQEASNA